MKKSILFAAFLFTAAVSGIFAQSTADEWFNKAYEYSNKGDYDSAIADYESALRIDPNYANAKRNLESTRRELGR